MSGNRDEDRNAELRAKVTALQAKTATDNQQALDFAPICDWSICCRA